MSLRGSADISGAYEHPDRKLSRPKDSFVFRASEKSSNPVKPTDARGAMSDIFVPPLRTGGLTP
jgi:hypothetical protein